MSLEERVLALEHVVSSQAKEIAVLAATIPMQFQAILDRLGTIAEDTAANRGTLERHSTRILAVEQRPELTGRVEALEDRPGRLAIGGWRLVGFLALAALAGALTVRGVPIVKFW